MPVGVYAVPVPGAFWEQVTRCALGGLTDGFGALMLKTPDIGPGWFNDGGFACINAGFAKETQQAHAERPIGMTSATHPPQSRAVLLDLARTLALIGMATFHFVFDLVLFGHVPPEVIMVGFWPLWARVVASSFLFLSGVGLYLAYGQGIDPKRLARRLLKIAGAAVVVSIGTRVMFAEQYVFWGILHMIAFGSVVGLVFLRLPVVVTLVVAAGVFWIGWTVALPSFDAPPLLFLGLGALRVEAVDYVPVFPWLAPVLAGVALGRLAVKTGVWAKIAAVTVPRRSLWDWLALPGRYSLWVYLGHQPVLIGLVWVWTFWL